MSPTTPASCRSHSETWLPDAGSGNMLIHKAENRSDFEIFQANIHNETREILRRIDEIQILGLQDTHAITRNSVYFPMQNIWRSDFKNITRTRYK